MPSHSLGRRENIDWPSTGGNHTAFSKADPLVAKSAKQVVTLRPIVCFVFAPFRMNLLRYIRRQTFNQTFHQDTER